MSLLSLQSVSLILANNQILEQASLHIQPKDRIALVGRNGAGKSTLLKLLQGEITPDAGHVLKQAKLNIASLMQEVPLCNSNSVYRVITHGLGETGQVLSEFHEYTKNGDLTKLAKTQQKIDALHAWDLLPKIEVMANRLGINLDENMEQLSGGMKRRVLLASALITNPDLLLLDEPTNHLDIESIEWLESYLADFTGSVVIVTHDRAFLSKVANRIVEIDRGKLHTHICDYETYLDRREAIRVSEQKANNLFDKKLAEEEVWIRTGVKARRTRNEGRVRALKALRVQYNERRKQTGSVKFSELDSSASGFLVFEAEHLSYSLNDNKIINDLSLLITRGDKLGVIGPNGCGKTTLLRLLLAEILPSTGRVKQGTSLNVAYFDQLRQQLDESKTVMYNVADGADYVSVNGKQKHVASYLQDFLFQSDRFNQPVSSLSGGERNRLLLARLFAKPVNLLIMDEPTNDLDIETLELLEQILLDYQGTLILISHDRAFIDNVVTSVLVYEGSGRFQEFVGGYQEYQAHKKATIADNSPKKQIIKPIASKTKLSFNEQRELSQLPGKIEKLEDKIGLLQNEMATPNFYQQDTDVLAMKSQSLDADEALLATYYDRWQELEERQKDGG